MTEAAGEPSPVQVIAFYLPQFHPIPENDEHWGEGFTEWVNVRRAKPLFDGHYQPRVPFGHDYYSLLDPATMAGHFDLARRYGLGGFCFYHYWFDGRLLLERPLEAMVDDPHLSFPYCLCWANESWTTAWKAGDAPRTIVAQRYGGRPEWRRHFDYLLRFFRDPNYIVEDGHPLLVIYRPELIDCLEPMLEAFRAFAVEAGFEGLKVVYQQVEFFDSGADHAKSLFDGNIEYQPDYAVRDLRRGSKAVTGGLKHAVKHALLAFERRTNIDVVDRLAHFTMGARRELLTFSYDEVWETVLARRGGGGAIAGAFVDWDNTPRKGERGYVVKDATPEKFERYLRRQLDNVRANYSDHKVFLFAWNEWAEGGYLEPDEKFGHGYLEALLAAQRPAPSS